MTPSNEGSMRLFRFAGINVFIHWSWFVAALYIINSRQKEYTSLAWNIAEYLTLFVIVLLHEFGHSLACRQVGGQADRIVLWPLGGVAYVNPPPRPGATLWAIAAGPLVNVVLALIGGGVYVGALFLGWLDAVPNIEKFLFSFIGINVLLLVFNLMPVYPLDGGQILRSILWFFIGPVRSLRFAVYVGFIGAAGVAALAVYWRSIWIGIMAFFIVLRCLAALKVVRMQTGEGRTGAACPSCRIPPPVGNWWLCGKCRRPFDTFATFGVCPTCQESFAVTACPRCGKAHPREAWLQPPPPPIPGSR